MDKYYLDKQGLKIVIDTLRKEIKTQNDNEEIILYGGSATELIQERDSS